MSAIERRPWPRDPRYLVGEDGSIVGPGAKGRPPGLLRSRVGTNGYVRVVLARVHESLHVVVCETFHGPRPAGMTVAHENGVRVDCRASNLSWKTRVDNCADKRRHGTHREGEDLPFAKLTEPEVRAIRRAAAAREDRGVIAVRYGISTLHVGGIVRREVWKHLAPAPDEDMTGVPRNFRPRRGEQSGTAKLTEDDVREIRRAYAAGEGSQRAIADWFGIEQTAVSQIVRRVRWAHVA